MLNTLELRNKLISMWDAMDSGKVSPQEARTHIGFARVVLDTLKVELAYAHLNLPSIPPVSLTKNLTGTIDATKSLT